MGQLAKTNLRIENEVKAGVSTDTLPSAATLLKNFTQPIIPTEALDTPLVQLDTGKIDLDNYEFQTDYKQPKEPVDNTTDIQPKVLIEESDGQIKVKSKNGFLQLF